MKNIAQAIANLSATAWVGSLWTVGYLAVPVLFYAQPDKQLAGLLAGQMFVKSGYLGMACASYLLWFDCYRHRGAVYRQTTFRIALAMAAITLIIQFGIQPEMNALKAQALPLDVMHSDLAGRFKMLHGVSSIAYLIESLLGLFLIIRRG